MEIKEEIQRIKHIAEDNLERLDKVRGFTADYTDFKVDYATFGEIPLKEYLDNMRKYYEEERIYKYLTRKEMHSRLLPEEKEIKESSTIKTGKGESPKDYIDRQKSYLQKATEVIEDTEGSFNKKLEYLLNAEGFNKYLKQSGYFEDVTSGIQDKLDEFTKEKGLKFFELSVSGDVSKGYTPRVLVNFNHEDMPAFYMATVFDITQQKVKYPMEVKLTRSQYRGYLLDYPFNEILESNKDKIPNEVAKIKDYDGKIEKTLAFRRKLGIKNERSEKVHRLKSEKESIEYSLREFLTNVEKDHSDYTHYVGQLDLIDKEIVNILDEHKLIMEYMGELFRLTTEYQYNHIITG